MKRSLAAAIWIAFSALTASAQQARDRPAFEAVSVKRTETPDLGSLASLPGRVAETMGFAGGPGTHDPGRINYRGVSLKMLLSRAYKVQPDQISGPEWLGAERYVIEATLPPNTNAAQLELMLQDLLTERFRISLHREAKNMPVYRLKIAKNGPRLKPPEELPHYADESEAREATKKQTQEDFAKKIAAMQANTRNGIRTPPSRSFTLPRATTAKFAEVLSGHLDRPVKDMTGLEGEYSFNLAWTPDTALNDEPSGVSIFTAIQEHWGSGWRPGMNESSCS